MYYFYLTIIFDRPILYNEFSMPNDLLEDQVNANLSDLWQQIGTDIDEAIPHLKLKSELPSENNLYRSENNDESIWEVQFADYKAIGLWQPGHHGPGAINAKYFSPHLNSYRNWEANPSMYYEFETDGAPALFDRDPRCYASLYFDGDLMDFSPDSPYYVGYRSGLNNKYISRARGLNLPSGTLGLGVKKYYFPVYWDGFYVPANEPTNRRIIRYADLLLLYAEVMHILDDDGTGFNPR